MTRRTSWPSTLTAKSPKRTDMADAPQLPTRQFLTHHTAGCFTCGASVDARNALAWAHNHVRRTGHKVELSLGYSITPEA